MAGRRGRKAWSEDVLARIAGLFFSNGSALMVKYFGQMGVVDRVRELWKQLTPHGLQPGPLAFSFMTVALVMYEHPDEALVLIHSHANSEKVKACINTVTYNTVLKGFTMGKRAKEVFSTFEAVKYQSIGLNTLAFNTMLGSIPILMAASAMQMVLVWGATSKVSEQFQFAQQVVSKSVQNSRTVQASGIERTSPTSTPIW